VDALELPVPERERRLSEDGGRARTGEIDGGRGRTGEIARGVAEDGGGGKTDEIEGRDLRRADDVGMVNRSAAGLEDGVEGRVGGVL